MPIIGGSTSCIVYSAYHIEREEIIAVKVSNNDKLTEREIRNYKCISHPFIPNFFGNFEVADKKYLLIELIQGKLMKSISEFHFTLNEKITLIFELMLVIEYIHRKGFVYRDLKPNNIMIDENKTLVLIDFDRMIKINERSSDSNFTVYFEPNFSDPDVNKGIVSYYNNIYSLGKMIYFIITEREPTQEIDELKFNDNELLNELSRIYLLCFNKDSEEKKSKISKILLDFYIQFHSHIQIENFFENYKEYLSDVYNKDAIKLMINYDRDENDDKVNYELYFLYDIGILVEKNIKKSKSIS